MEWLPYSVVVAKAFQGMGSMPAFSRPRTDQWSSWPRPRPRFFVLKDHIPGTIAS